MELHDHVRSEVEFGDRTRPAEHRISMAARGPENRRREGPCSVSDTARSSQYVSLGQWG